MSDAVATGPEDRRPDRPVIVVVGNKVSKCSTDAVSPSSVGAKAFGLSILPSAWTPRFFVVLGGKVPTKKALERAARLADMSLSEAVIVRSNGTKEGMQERGALDSKACGFEDIQTTIQELSSTSRWKSAAGDQEVHYVVQVKVSDVSSGHLSNERRITSKARDWLCTIEGESSPRPVAVRNWRDNTAPKNISLGCTSTASITRTLRTVAKWVLPHRAHLEWVWDGHELWVVQLDFLGPLEHGVNPRALVKPSKSSAIEQSQLRAFAIATDTDYSSYRKLENVLIYKECGYVMPDYFILKDAKLIAGILAGNITNGIQEDLKLLTTNPFVIRTDATFREKSGQVMLPRSDELRSVEEAIAFFKDRFAPQMKKLKGVKNVALIGHHFVPAIASAWCQASSDSRRVRIESLWGIPEGLYYFAHDVNDIDTGESNIDRTSIDSCRRSFSRIRYKEKFIAPNDIGHWVVHKTAEGPDWSSSIPDENHLHEIAVSSRKISAKAGFPVIVMWFIGVADKRLKHKLIPWHHEEFKGADFTYRRAAPGTKFNRDRPFTIRSRADFSTLKASLASHPGSVGRVDINPDESSIVRDADFLKELAEHSVTNKYVIELSGGLLSHAFYLLTTHKCIVECVDLVATEEEELEFKKLVRDEIPTVIEERGEEVQVIQLRGAALNTAVKRKVVEEALELYDAKNREDAIEELADLAEIIDALEKSLDIRSQEVAEARRRKLGKRGGFDKGLMLVSTALTSPLSKARDGSPKELPYISRSEDLPDLESTFNVDRRRDSSGISERQVTLTMPIVDAKGETGSHIFDIELPNGDKHRMLLSAFIERSGARLKVKIRLQSAAKQLSLELSALDGVASKSKAKS